jgi:hypothetical protein
VSTSQPTISPLVGSGPTDGLVLKSTLLAQHNLCAVLGFGVRSFSVCAHQEIPRIVLGGFDVLVWRMRVSDARNYSC